MNFWGINPHLFEHNDDAPSLVYQLRQGRGAHTAVCLTY